MRPQPKLETQALARNSFEDNLEQISKTNRLLSSIERKLNNYAYDEPQLTPQAIKSPIASYQSDNRRPRNSQVPERDKNLSNIDARLSNPTADKEFLQYLSPSDDAKHPRTSSKQAGSLFFAGESQHQEFLPTNSRSFHTPIDKNFLMTGPQSYEKRFSGVLDTNFTPQTTTSPPSKGFRNRKEARSPSKEFLAGLGIQVDAREGERKMSGHILVETMNKVEDFYENRVKLLEEKLSSSEAEVQMLKQFQQKLQNELRQLKADSTNWQDALLHERRRSSLLLKEQIDKDAPNDQRRTENLQMETGKLRKQMDELAKRYDIGVKDNDTLKSQYDELMKLHNQMIEIDMHKNEKSLRGQSISGGLYTQGLGFQGSDRNWLGGEDLAGAINSYKNELNLLRVKNNRTQTQLEAEVQKLKEELKAQKKENRKLKSAMAEKSPVSKKRLALTTTESSAKKKKRERSDKSERKLARSNSKMKLEKEEQETLNYEGLTKYTRNLQDTYINLQGENQQLITHNEGLHKDLKTLRETVKDQCANFNETFAEVFEKTRHWTTGLHNDRSGENIRDLRSTEKIRSPQKDNDKRHRLRLALQKDLAEIPVLDRAMSPKDISSPRVRTKSKSVRSPKQAKENKGKNVKKSPRITEHGEEFKKEVNNLKEMINQKVQLKLSKPRRRSGDFTRTRDLHETPGGERLNATAQVTPTVKSKNSTVKNEQGKQKRKAY